MPSPHAIGTAGLTIGRTDPGRQKRNSRAVGSRKRRLSGVRLVELWRCRATAVPEPAAQRWDVALSATVVARGVTSVSLRCRAAVLGWGGRFVEIAGEGTDGRS